MYYNMKNENSVSLEAGPRLNIETVFPRYWDFKMRTIFLYYWDYNLFV